MADSVKILGIAGSICKASFNRSALRAAQKLAPEGASIEIFEIDGLPGFNQDDENNPPAKVTELKTKIRAADAILFVTPEYNYSIPGVLKNAIDWASRPYGNSAWNGKAVAVMGGVGLCHRHCPRAIPSAPGIRVSGHGRGEPAGSDDQCVERLRRSGQPDRPADQGPDRQTAREPRQEGGQAQGLKRQDVAINGSARASTRRRCRRLPSTFH